MTDPHTLSEFHARAHPQAAFATWTCPDCGVSQRLDPRADIKRIVNTLPPPLNDRSPQPRLRSPAVPTLELVARRCREADCASVTFTASLGEMAQRDARRAHGEVAIDPMGRSRMRSQGESTFHLTPRTLRPALPATLPDTIRRDVLEARSIAAASPRAAAALYRRALKAMVEDDVSHRAGPPASWRELVGDLPTDPFTDVAPGDLARLSRLVEQVALACYAEDAA